MITGTNKSDLLEGGLGADRMSGLIGNDTYIVNNVSGSGEPGTDTVTEAAGGGIDTVIVTDTVPTYTLGANVENLTALGNADGTVTLTGNELDNSITGNGQNNGDGN